MAKSKRATSNRSKTNKSRKTNFKLPKFLNQRIVTILGIVIFALIGTVVLNGIFAAESYKVLWSDEFDGTSIDKSKWGVYHNTYGDGNNEIACLTPNNVTVSGGTLKISAKREAITCPGSSRDDFSSGFIATRSIGSTGSGTTSGGKFYPKYAKYEIRAKVPHGQGLWPAYWLRHRSGSSTAEIDVMEYFHAQVPGKTTATIHLDNKKNVTKKTVSFESPTNTPGWHTWTVEITPDSSDDTKAHINFLLDGTSFLETTPTQQEWAKTGNSESMFDMAINLAVGGTYNGHPDDDLGYSRDLGACLKPYNGRPPCDSSNIRRASFPAVYEVDYVRVYTLQPDTGGDDTGGDDTGGDDTPEDETTTTLAAPTNLSAVASDGSVRLTWDAVSGADNYTVRWGTGGNWTNYSNDSGSQNNPASNSYIVSGLTNGTKYNFSVAARDNTATYDGSTYSDSAVSIPEAAAPTKLSTPTNLQASADDKEVTLTWNAVSGADNYTVRWGTGGNWTTYSNERGNSYNPKTNTYTVTGLTNGTTYNFSVAARDSSSASEGSAYSGSVTSAPMANNPVSSLIPQDLSLAVGHRRITASWAKVNDDRITAYEVRYIRSDSNSKNNPAAWVYPGRTSSTSYAITNLSNGVSYDVQVRAIATKGTSTTSDDEYSNFSSTDSGTPNWYKYIRFW